MWLLKRREQSYEKLDPIMLFSTTFSFLTLALPVQVAAIFHQSLPLCPLRITPLDLPTLNKNRVNSTEEEHTADMVISKMAATRTVLKWLGMDIFNTSKPSKSPKMGGSLLK